VHETTMAQEAVVSLFETFYPISATLREAINSHSYLLKVKKKQLLLDIGDIQHSIYFIIKGSVRTYYRDHEGEEVTSWLLYEQDLAISVFSFFSQKPSFEALETLEDSSLLVLNHEKLIRLYHSHLEFNFIGRVLTEQYYIKSEEKANELRMCSATERYLNLLYHRPDVLKRTALGIVASYLGISRSTLSRIRAKI
jgi:cAMP-binding proteins - catabolite gene activator and regulatory subunit of cAMP-dependent protein kinases